MRVEVEMLNGKKVFVGGRPLMSDADLYRSFPDLQKAMETHDGIIDEQARYTDDPDLLEKDQKGFAMLIDKFKSAMGDICFAICSIFNDGLQREKFLIDGDTYKEIMMVWNGSYQKKS